MPTIANYHHRRPASQHAVPRNWRRLSGLGSAIASRIDDVWHRGARTRELAAGWDPTERPELARRAQQLTRRGNRRALARSLRHISAEAHRPTATRSRVITVRRSPVLEAEELIGVLAARLESPRPVRPQGMAELHRILTNADRSPLYNPSEPGTLRRLLTAVLETLEPGGPSEFHEFPIAS
jgi:hypothetical protein